MDKKEKKNLIILGSIVAVVMFVVFAGCIVKTSYVNSIKQQKESEKLDKEVKEYKKKKKSKAKQETQDSNVPTEYSNAFIKIGRAHV